MLTLKERVVMSKPKKIDLNKWERVDNAEDLDGYQALIITPLKASNGIQLPDLMFRKGQQKHNEIEDVDSVEWNKEIRISKEGGDDVYAYRIDWWFNNASQDEQYRKFINDNFNKNGFDVKRSWNAAQNYLKKFNYSSRKTYLHKYVYNWLVTGMHRWNNFAKR